MSSFIEKNHKIFAIIGTSIIIIIIFSGLLFGPLNSILPDSLREKLGYIENSSNSEIVVQLIINFNGFHTDINQTITISENESATAFSILLIAKLVVEYENYSYGIFVKGIERVLQDTIHYWWYYVDGESAGIASNNFDLRQNNSTEVNWVYKTS